LSAGEERAPGSADGTQASLTQQIRPGAGGLDQVATILSELSERLDPEKLVSAAGSAPLPWAQRLGYLLERVGAQGKAAPLKAYVRARA